MNAVIADHTVFLVEPATARRTDAMGQQKFN